MITIKKENTLKKNVNDQEKKRKAMKTNLESLFELFRFLSFDITKYIQFSL